MQFIYPEGKVTGYRRSLSLDEAISSVSFNSGGVNYKREYLLQTRIMFSYSA